MGIEKMLRMHLLQIWFNLSAPATEDAIYDSHAMRKFTGIAFMTEALPDKTTLCNFRHLLEANGLNKLFFDAINRVMVQSGHMMKGCTCHSRGRCQRVLHERRRCLCCQNMGKASVLLAFVTGIGAAIVFQDFLLLRNDDHLPADQLFANELKGTAALATGKLRFRQIKDDFLHRQILCQLVNGSPFLPSVGFYSKDFLRRSFCLVVLTDFSLIEQTHLVLAQDIGFLLTGLTTLGSLSVGEHLVHVLQLAFQIVNFRFLFLNGFFQNGGFGSGICSFLLFGSHGVSF